MSLRKGSQPTETNYILITNIDTVKNFDIYTN